MAKNAPANAGDIRDAGSIPGWGRSPGGGHGSPLQYSCLDGPMDRGVWWATVHGVTKSDMTEATKQQQKLREQVSSVLIRRKPDHVRRQPCQLTALRGALHAHAGIMSHRAQHYTPITSEGDTEIWPLNDGVSIPSNPK